MSYETWPTIFPDPVIQFNGKMANATIRTQMETGRIRQRRRFTSELRSYSASWQMTDFQFGMFQSWFLYKISGGADFFNISLPTGGEELKSVLARFNGGYSETVEGIIGWRVTATLEVEDALVWSEKDYDALLGIGDLGELEDIAERLDTWVTA